MEDTQYSELLWNSICSVYNKNNNLKTCIETEQCEPHIGNMTNSKEEKQILKRSLRMPKFLTFKKAIKIAIVNIYKT